VGAAFLILAVSAFRVWFLLTETTLSLSTDEAHYWDWSRHLDWCYYSKGPLVAWLIRASCWLNGADTMAAVRFPAVLCSALTMVGVYVLVFRVYQDACFALLALLAALTLPFLHVGGLLMTIDAPYCCAWTWAVVVAHIIISRDEANRRTIRLWLMLGIIVGLGVLAKHNMALFVPSLGLFLLLSRDHRGELWRPGFWVMAVTGALIGGGPILWWNSQHDWVTFLHVGTQAGVQTAGSGFRWTGPFELIGIQAALLLGLWFVLMVMGVVRTIRAWLQGVVQADQLFLTCLAVPLLVICLVFSLKVRIEPNWPVTAYITGLVLAAGVLRGKLPIRRWRRTTGAVCVVGVMLSALIYRSEVLYPLHQALWPDVSPRRWDATCRLKGYATLAEAVDELRRKEARPPMLIGSNWSYTGALAFHLPDQPRVYCIGPVAGSRHSQYDLWRPNPLYDPEQFAGRDAIIVGDITPQVKDAFERIETPMTVKATSGGLVVAEWRVTVARGFKANGFGELRVGKH
jgi:4-amino-4-deoxy-L-arabinose transferase-like glycosyltransferase